MSLKIFARVLAMACMAVAAHAGSPFAGTWVADLRATEFSLRPLELSITNGKYKRASCWVADEVAADGAEHALGDNPFFDAMSVRIVDPLHVEVTQKSAGRTTWTGAYSVAADLRSMTLRFTDGRATEPVTGLIRYEREGEPTSGAHALTGTWQGKELAELSPSGRSMTIEDIDNGVTLHAADGRNFAIRFGGRSNEPLHGYLEGAMVHVGRRTPNTLQINRTQNGTLVEMVLGQVSGDGQSMEYGQTDWPCQSQTTLIFRKQPPS